MVSIYKMSDQRYMSQALLAKRRPVTIPNSAERLTESQCASLKARKQKIANDRKKGVDLHVFECGHVYRSLTRAWLDIGGPKTKIKGMCNECWRYIVTDGRRVCLDNPGKVRRRPKSKSKSESKSETSYKTGVAISRPTRPIGEHKQWRLRGLMVGR